MDANRPPQDPRTLWQSQPHDPLDIPAETIRGQVGQFQRTIRRRNLVEYLASVFVIGVFGWQAVSAEGLAARIGPALMLVGTLYIVWRLYTQGSTRALPPEAVADSCLAFYRRELERQHRLVSTVWRWYLGPFIPGLAFMLIHSALTRPGTGHLVKLGIFGAFCVLMFLIVGKANQAAARQLRQDIQALDAESSSQ